MFLTSQSLAYWLIQRGLLDPSVITQGNFAVEELEFHNRGFGSTDQRQNPYT